MGGLTPGRTAMLPGVAAALFLLTGVTGSTGTSVLAQDFIRGDSDSTGGSTLDIPDGLWILNYVIQTGVLPPCLDAADANDDGTVSIADAVYVLNYVFAGGPAPPEPYPSCGSDVTPDGLDCGGYTLCP